MNESITTTNSDEVVWIESLPHDENEPIIIVSPRYRPCGIGQDELPPLPRL
jgi:hypothetical protein